MPWCIKKCPYCDFNSHVAEKNLPEDDYINALIKDFTIDYRKYNKNPITTIFIGGGTPSLFSAKAYDKLLNAINNLCEFTSDIEITLEANPGTLDNKHFKEYKNAGINRLSIGVQSFNDTHLKKLGRIHDSQTAINAIKLAQDAGFENINLDIMYSLENQSIEEGINDLKTAISFNPTHISWYQLTIEQNTVFHKYPPSLPNDDFTSILEEEGFNLLQQNDYERYEISAFAKNKQFARHNLNYWLFGDYYGIGAGAHGKLTLSKNNIIRTRKHKMPATYLKDDYLVEEKAATTNDLIFEFMLNTTRLNHKIPKDLFTKTTGIEYVILKPLLERAELKGLIKIEDDYWHVSDKGRKFTNDLQLLFLKD